MADVNPAAESSAATVPANTQFDSWDEGGQPIVSKKSEAPQSEEPAASAPPAKAADSEPKGKSAAESETATDSQEKARERKPGEKKSLDERKDELKELLAELKAERQQLAAERERSRQPAPKQDAKPQPQSYKEWRAEFKPKQWLEQYAKEHPDADYDDAVAAMADFQADVRDQFRAAEEARAELSKKQAEMLRRTEERYPDAKEAIKPTLLKTLELVGTKGEPVVEAIGQSEVFSDLLYVLGPEIDGFIALAKSDPVKAQRKVFLMEQEILKELAKPKGEAKPGEKPAEKKTEPETPPAKAKPRLPDTPAEIGGRGSSPEDPSVEAARSGNFSSFDAEQRRRHFAGR